MIVWIHYNQTYQACQITDFATTFAPPGIAATGADSLARCRCAYRLSVLPVCLLGSMNLGSVRWCTKELVLKFCFLS